MAFMSIAFPIEAAVSGSMTIDSMATYTGAISWDAPKNCYDIRDKLDNGAPRSMSFALHRVIALDIQRPPQLDAAIQDSLDGRNDNVISVLTPLLDNYLMLQHDEEIASLLAEAHLGNGNTDEAVKVCELVIEARKEAAYKGKLFPTYWKILLTQNNAALHDELLKKARLPDGTFAVEHWDTLKAIGRTDSLRSSIKKAQTRGVAIPSRFTDVVREMAILDKQKAEADEKNKQNARLAKLAARRTKYAAEIKPIKDDFNRQRQTLAASLENSMARHKAKFSKDGNYPGIKAIQDALQNIKLSNSREIQMNYDDKTADLRNTVEQHNKQLRDINTKERESDKIRKTTQEHVDFLNEEMTFFTLAEKLDVADEIFNEIVLLKRTVNLQPLPKQSGADATIKLPSDQFGYSLFICPVDDRTVKTYGFYADGTFICAHYNWRQSAYVEYDWIAKNFNRYARNTTSSPAVTKGTYKIQGSEILFSKTVDARPGIIERMSSAYASKGELGSPTSIRIGNDSYHFRGIVKNGKITR